MFTPIWNDIKCHNRNDLLRQCILYVMEKLPDDSGYSKVPRDLLVLTIHATPRSNIVSQLLWEMGHTPERRGDEGRMRQLTQVIEGAFHTVNKVVVIIENAHLLSSKVLCHIHHFREMISGDPLREEHVGVILLGDVCRIKIKIENCREMTQRALFFADVNGFPLARE